MANYYTAGICFVSVPEDKMAMAKQIVADAVAAIEEDDDFIGMEVTIDEDGITMGHAEYFEPAHTATILQQLVDGMEIDEPIAFYWSFSCDKLRHDAFGGGGCLIRRNREPYWVNPAEIIDQVIKEE